MGVGKMYQETVPECESQEQDPANEQVCQQKTIERNEQVCQEKPFGEMNIHTCRKAGN